MNESCSSVFVSNFLLEEFVLFLQRSNIKWLVYNTYKSLLTMISLGADYGLKSRIPGEHIEIKSSLF